MEYNSILPALVPAVLILIAASLAAWIGLAWDKRPSVQTFIRRAWLAVTVICVAGVFLFWLSTVLVEGPRRATIDRSLQREQQDELHRRVQRGGH